MAGSRACLADYNTFVRYYNENPLRSARDHANFRSSLATLSARISRLRRACPSGSPEADLLARLADGAAHMYRSMDAP